MGSKEAKVGTRVRVRQDHSKPMLRGRHGTIAQRWGAPAYAALEVWLDEGGSGLFWSHELEAAKETPALVGPWRQLPFYDGG
jgi:hypothetical protein